MRSLALCLLCWLPIAAAQEPVDLEVARVAIFNSGVAYYECRAEVDGNGSAELDFRTEQINDILKSLMVQDLNGGRIGVVRYGSQDPIEKTLKSFGVDITGKPTLAQLLDQLRGQPVEISGPRTLNGLIVGVETRRVENDGNVTQEAQLNVLTEAGIQQLPISQLGGIRLTNEKVAEELQKALVTLARSNDASKKSVQLNFEGTGKRKVRVAYLLEAPIWKTSYRLALDDEGVPFLQGWATVENATEEDWDGVRLSLVSGRPISFRMDLYSPIYIPRPLEELELYASLRPPTYAAGTKLQARKVSPTSAFGGGQGARGMRPGMAAMANDDMAQLESLGYVGRTNSSLPAGWTANDSFESVADAADAGELFQYTISAPVTLPRQQSAMLPIVNEQIEGRKVSIYNEATHTKHPLNGLEITNTSDLNLMQGPVTLFDGEVYAGDAKLPDMQPKEKRLIAYALDLSTEVVPSQKSNPVRLVSARLVNGALIRTNKYVNERSYTITNKSDRKRTVLVEQPWTDDWKLIAPAKVYEKTANLLRFDVDVEAGQTVELPVRMERMGDQSIALGNLNNERIEFFIRAREVSNEVRTALERVIELKRALAVAASNRQQAEQAYEAATKEQARVRQNLNTLRNATDAYKRQIAKFEKIETEIEQTRERVEAAKQNEKRAEQQVNDYLANLNVE